MSDSHFNPTTGYGYGDKGRETLDLIYARVFGAQSALVRLNFVNGTHAITTALFGVLRPGEVLLSATGAPYDTILDSISAKTGGSLQEFGVGYKQIDLTADGGFDYPAIGAAISLPNVKMIYVQRSKGYTSRRALNIAQIGDLCEFVHKTRPDVAVFVDNCYGEFVEKLEPCHVGANLVAGSLIKNPGGGLAPTGGYIAGDDNLVQLAANRLTSVGIGGECGSTLGHNRELYQGLFMAPHTVLQAIKTALFCAKTMELLGFETAPRHDEIRYDIIQAINFGDEELVKAFCRGIQAGAAVDSYVTPEAWAMPGYDCPVIMAAGTFISGASIELSADAPIRPPYTVYMQGGLTYESGKFGIMTAIDKMLEIGK